MSTTSPQEQQAQQLYGQVGSFNSQAPNLFQNYKMPFSPNQQIGALNDYTNQGVQSINQQTQTNANQAGGGAMANALSHGYGGSIAQGLASGAREQAGAAGTNALQQLQANRLALLPGIMSGANQQQFNVTGAEQGVNQQNILNRMNQFGQQQGLLGAFSPNSTLDDILAGLNTGAGIAGAVSGIPGIF
ncbi:MAG: hypothetical protein ACYDBV_11155 [Nitrospiria bacterium]